MTLRTSIVIVNEFSVPLPDGKGSRGATPGRYITRYMAREQATESLAPIQRRRTDGFLSRYASRDAAAEGVMTSRSEVHAAMRQAQGDGGVAFGHSSASLSAEDLHAVSADIQQRFDKGKTVLKTVLSFDEDYLKRRRVLSTDFHGTTRGAYRGRIDQMKLRMSIMHGLTLLAGGTSGFDDLRYVGVIQVDTEHVHCHLVLVDAGTGSRTSDGTQRGKLLERHKSRLRRGIDTWLREKQAVTHLSSAAGYEHRNVATYAARWAHERINAESLLQFLIACLPAQRHLWRTGTGDPRMRKPDRLITDLVTQHLTQPGSLLPAAVQRITEPTTGRRDHENLSDSERQRIADQGHARLVKEAVDGVYQLLRTVPEAELQVHTPLLDVMSLSYPQMATLLTRARTERTTLNSEPDLLSFGFRVRSCATRLRHHVDQAGVYEDLARQWERAAKSSAAAEDSRPLYDFYRFEADYHRCLMRKYHHMLPFTVDTTQWSEQQHRITRYRERLHALEALRDDISLARLNDSEHAEQLGREVHGQPGGALLTEGPPGRAVLDARIATVRRLHDDWVEALRSELASAGLVLQTGSTVQPAIAGLATTDRGAGDFNQVKALDLHHLGLDFATDVPIGPQALRIFTASAAERRRLILAAIGYLDDSGQPEAIGDLPVNDVAAMARLARELLTPDRTSGPAPQMLCASTSRPGGQSGPVPGMPRSGTAPLGTGIAVRVHEQIAATVDAATPRLDQPQQ
ncbi:relaxase MobL [Amycolatopsis azurea]|uniref:relaxase MobL n=1 Tax=Amycolatopsis azurea TaxID=36819 RepID=UPI003823273B